MENLYAVLRNPAVENLHFHSIEYFDTIIEKYPHDYEKIIAYCNDCFNYQSPLLIEEKDWGIFLTERFIANNIPDEFESDIMQYESKEFTFALSSFLAHQKQDSFTTLIAKQNLRQNMLANMQSFSATNSEKKTANDLVSTLDIEIRQIFEAMKQDQKKFGNYKGYEAVKSARNKHKINIANFVE